MIIYVHVMFTFLPYYFFVLYIWWMFCNNRKTLLKKDEILMLFTNSCNYGVLIIVEWIC
jgi:cbb3-type cytochrome oxidase subunit 3